MTSFVDLLALKGILTASLMAGRTIATAESLTAGMVAARLADLPGISQVYKGGIIAYDNSVKAQALGVDRALLESNGSVDPQVALSMAKGAVQACGSNLGLSTTGVAGPDPHDGKDVGTVFVAIYAKDVSYASQRGKPQDINKIYNFSYSGSRRSIREQATESAIASLQEILDIILNS